MYQMKKTSLAVAAALGLGFGLSAQADIEISGFLKNETSFYINDDQLIGEEKHQMDSDDHHGSVLKFENTAKVFMNGPVGEESSWHVELNFVYDTEGVESEYKGHESYTQHDWLREAYIDTTWGETAIRIGKQQVVWGTADGIKLLDIINPTDYREFSQNTMEGSRIPIWMLNVDHPVGDYGSLQFIVSQHEENKIPGMDEDGDDGHPYTMQGVDTVTGEVNGFLNIVPTLTAVATSFSDAANMAMFGPGTSGWGLVPFGTAMSVDAFTSLTWDMSGGFMAPAGFVTNFANDPVQNLTSAMDGNAATGANGYTMMNAIAQQGLFGLGMLGPVSADPLANNSVTNLMAQRGSSQWDMTAPSTATVSWNIQNPTSAFEYMPNASFATFNNSAGNTMWGGPVGNSQSAYVRDYPDDDELNFGVRFKNSTEGGFNYSLNYFYGYDSNPHLQLECRDAVTGQVIQHELRRPSSAAFAFYGDPTRDGFGNSTTITNDQVANNFDGTIGVGYRVDPTDPRAMAGSGRIYYGAFSPVTGAMNTGAAGSGTSGTGIVMTFIESVNRTNNYGGSFDYSFDTDFSPIVIRGEFLYKEDEMHPVIDKRLLGIGYMPEALVSEEHDMFKYVIGVDFRVLTNMMISTQFIQFRNLDWVDDDRTCTTQMGNTWDCSRYTADAPTMHLTNGMNQAEENKEFISVFLSKPFGSEQQGRWNNLTILEDTGGYWNRFDVEYEFINNLVGTAELNMYWGDNDDSWFGQLEETSNIQVGVKYIFD